MNQRTRATRWTLALGIVVGSATTLLAACVDDARNVAELSAAADACGVVVDVLVEVNVGQDRCGVAPGEQTLQLVHAVKGARFLRFAGLHAYHGSAQHLRSVAERRVAIEQAAAKARRTRLLLGTITPSPRSTSPLVVLAVTLSRALKAFSHTARLL